MLQRAFLILTLGLALQAQAGQFDYLPASTPAEKEFLGLMNSGNFKHALTSWNAAHGMTRFGQTADGKATGVIWYERMRPGRAPESGRNSGRR